MVMLMNLPASSESNMASTSAPHLSSSGGETSGSEDDDGGAGSAAAVAASSVPTSTGLLIAPPRASLVCRPNSHPFQERTLQLSQAAKVGRSVARARPSNHNAIFDCKVLSRNHALLWYENGKFFLQDTKSSNGTFVNNQRLSKGSEESLPREVCSGDILQFGVDVMENSRKVTHGCIIATLRLYLPDGKEAKASPTIMGGPVGAPGSPVGGVAGAAGAHLAAPDLYQLNQFIQEALVREQMLETKLAVLQRVVGQTELASSDAWQALIDEDRLLTRVEILEGQLSAYSKGMTEDKLREETRRLMEEKETYQEVTKATLKKLADEKLAAVKKMKELEAMLSSTEDEYTALKELYDRGGAERQKLAEDVTRLGAEMDELKRKSSGEADANSGVADAADTASGDVTTSQPPELSKDTQEKLLDLEQKLAEKEAELAHYMDECSQLRQADVNRQTTLVADSSRESPPQSQDETASEKQDSATLDLNQSESERRRLGAEVTELKQALANSTEMFHEAQKQQMQQATASPAASASRDEENKVEQLKSELSKANSKISDLLKVKEKYLEVSQVKSELETSFHDLESEVQQLSLHARVATFCSIGPLMAFFLAFMAAFLPFMSAIFGTKE